MRKILILGLLFGTIGAWVGGCTGDDDDDDDHAAPDSITLTPANPTVAVGSSLQMTATGNFPGGETEDLSADSTWTSSSSNVATVSGTGLVTANSAGQTTITATHDGVGGFTTVTVNAPGTFNFSVGATSWPHGGATQGTGVRVLDSLGEVIFCRIEENVGGSWTMGTAGIITAGEDYTVEVWGDFGAGDNNSTYNNGQDHRWSFDVTDATPDYNADFDPFDHGLGQSAITWANNTGCPGE